MSEAWLLFPHTLFEQVKKDVAGNEIRLIEPALFFTQYAFHRQKLFLHRVSMARFAGETGGKVYGLEEYPTLEAALTGLKGRVHVYELVDDWLERELREACATHGLELEVHPSPGFLTPLDELQAYAKKKERFFAHHFYQWQRKRLGVLIDADGGPEGGQWSFDAENRDPLPRSVPTPARPSFDPPEKLTRATEAWLEAHYSGAYGELNPGLYPTTHIEAKQALDHFVAFALPNFGRYEDAMRHDESFLFHSVLTPALNTGLLTPQQVLDAVLEASDIPLASREGFVRQLISWRELMRVAYLMVGRKQRTRNFLDHNAKLPRGFWDGTTGIPIIDDVVKRVLKTGYCHHIERLMVLSNAMMMLEVDPDAVYEWFMALFIDAYDWVMVPNVYGMGQFADGGMISTKPYFAGSGYLRKMGDWPKHPTDTVWDALYWRFVHRHRALLDKNPRTKLAGRTWDKMSDEKKRHLAQTLRDWLTTQEH